MKLLWIIISIIILTVGIVAYVVVSYPGEEDTPIDDPDDPDDEIGFYSQQLIVNYADGSHSNDLIGYIYQGNKKVDDITYSLYITPDEKVTVNIQFYYFEYQVLNSDQNMVKDGQVYFSDLYNLQADGKTLVARDTFDIFDFINYTYPDGTYTIRIVPSGQILIDNVDVNLPDLFSFTIEMIDERSVDINFG